MQCNGIFSPVVKHMETIKCIYFEHSRCGVPKRDYAPYEIHTYSVIDERKIDRITPSREKFTLDPSLLRGSVPSPFLKNLTDKTGTPANLTTFPFDML